MRPDIRWIPVLKLSVRVGLGLALGLAFIYAGTQKFRDPFEFAASILAYQLLPSEVVGLLAAGLPVLEAVAGFLLILGGGWLLGGSLWGRAAAPGQSWGSTWRRVALEAIILQLVIFIGVLLLTLGRGLEISCGCGLVAERPVGWAAVGEDLILLALALWLWQQEWRQPYSS